MERKHPTTGDWVAFFMMMFSGLMAINVYRDDGFTSIVFACLVCMFVFAVIYLKDFK